MGVASKEPDPDAAMVASTAEDAPVPESVPVVDLDAYRRGLPADRVRFIEDLGDGLRRLGFVRVRGHEVSPDLLKPAYAAAEAFFALPESVKRSYQRPGGRGARGYTPFGAEHAKDVLTPDLKEFWHTGRELDRDHWMFDSYPQNVWPSEIPGFRAAMLAVYAAADRCAYTLLQALALYLDQPMDVFTSMTDHGNSILRSLHYPPLDGVDIEPGAIRAAAHEDINFITLLATSTASGLELLQRDGSWLPVNAELGELVVDSGDMIQRVTNGLFPATTHRVVNPDDSTRARYSMPFFMHPRPDSVLRVLDCCKGSGFPPPPPDITGFEYLLRRLRAIGLA